MPQARIELLIRKPGAEGEGFNIRKVGSEAAYAGYRPRRISPEGYEERMEVSREGENLYNIRATSQDDGLTLTEREHFIWELMEGTRGIKTIASAYFFRYGEKNVVAITALIGRLRGAGLIEFVPASRLREALEQAGQGLIGRLKELFKKGR